MITATTRRRPGSLGDIQAIIDSIMPTSAAGLDLSSMNWQVLGLGAVGIIALGLLLTGKKTKAKLDTSRRRRLALARMKWAAEDASIRSGS